MSATDSNARILAALPDLNADILRDARRHWQKSSPMRQVLAVEAENLIKALRGTLETCQPEELKDLQGQIKGIRSMLAAANAQGDI